MFEKEVVMHQMFDATNEEIQEFIEPFLQEEARICNMVLSQYERTGNKITWWYKSGYFPKTGESEPFYSDVLITPPPWGETPTEILIECLDHPALVNFFVDLARKLWEAFPKSGEPITSPSGVRPKFCSPIEWDTNEDLEDMKFDDLFGDGSEGKDNETSVREGGQFIRQQIQTSWPDWTVEPGNKLSETVDMKNETEVTREGHEHSQITQRSPRSDMLKRVGFARYMGARHGVKTRRSMAARAHTSTDSIKRYEKHPEVREWFEQFMSDEKEANKFRQELARKKQK